MLLHCVRSYGSPELQVLLIAYLEWLQAPKKANKVYKARNPLLTRGVERYSRSQSYIRSGLLKVKSKKAIAKKAEPAAAAKRAPGFYPADDVRGKFRNNKKAKPTKLRASLTPGTVVIILAGRFRGKRAVFIKQLPSGMLLVNGPFAVNGVPIRRVNQAYVIATKTTVDVSAVNAAKFDDAYFKRPEKKVAKKSESEFFAKEEAKQGVSQGRKDDQAAIDKALLGAVKAVPQLKGYLRARFSLSNGQAPHELVF